MSAIKAILNEIPEHGNLRKGYLADIEEIFIKLNSNPGKILELDNKRIGRNGIQQTLRNLQKRGLYLHMEIKSRKIGDELLIFAMRKV